MFRNSFRNSFRVVYALLVAVLIVTGVVGAAHAQSAPTYEPVKVVMQDGWSALGRHAIADDFVIVCPTEDKTLPDPNHPCNTGFSSQISRFDDFVLVCPVAKELGDNHPCDSRQAQIINARPSDFVLVRPVEKDLKEPHPCNGTNAQMAQFKIPGDKVMTCPVKPVLDPNHPCSRRSR